MPVSPSDPLIAGAARRTGLPPAVVAAQVNEESGGNPAAVSPAGAEGEFQFLPSTYTGLGFPAGTEFNPAVEVRAYEEYMGSLLTWAGGDVRQALAAYNAGQDKWQAGVGYADTILSSAKAGPGLTATPPGETTIGGQLPQAGGLGGFVSGVWKDLQLPFSGAEQLLGSASAIAQAIAAVAAPLVKIAEAIDWFFHPAHWIRLFAGVAGGVLVLGGVWQMSHAGGA